jgi:hypothetical protein
LLLAVLLSLGACGGNDQKTSVHTVTAPPQTVTAEAQTTPTSTGLPDCKAAGMTRKTGGREGTCKDPDGTISTVVDKDHKLSMKTINARLNECRTATSVGSGEFTSVAKGTFVICSVRVTNKLDTPIDYGAGHSAALSIDSGSYDEDFDAENQNDEQSFLSQNGNIQPGEARAGDFVFDLPTRRVNKINTQGVLALADAGDDIADATRFGLIRLYK